MLLQWSPEEYGSVDQVRIPTTDIWGPDIVLYNGYVSKFMFNPYPAYRNYCVFSMFAPNLLTISFVAFL